MHIFAIFCENSLQVNACFHYAPRKRISTLHSTGGTLSLFIVNIVLIYRVMVRIRV